jgi:CubicO group peptidase (beta-lactamase class C family)
VPNVHVRSIVALLATLAALTAAAPAQAARTCPEPAAGDWERVTPDQAGMDAARLQQALDYGTSQASFAVRVYRNGCLVGEDRAAATNRATTYESWSMAKSVTSLVFGRALTLGLIHPDDVVGGLVPEASDRHGAIRVRDLLTMTSGCAGTACATTTSSRCPTASATRSRSSASASRAPTTSTRRARWRCSPRPSAARPARTSGPSPSAS